MLPTKLRSMQSRDPRALPVPDAWERPITVWLEHLAAAGSSRQSIKTRADHLRRIARALGGDPWAADTDHLVSWASRQTWARETRRSVYNSARNFWRWAIATGYTTDNPTLALPHVKTTDPRPRPAPEVVVHQALDAVVGTRIHVAVRLAAEAGMRRAEVAHVHANDLQQDLAGWSIIAHGKGDKDRPIPLTDDLATAVLMQCRRGGGWMLPGRIDGHLSPEYVGKLVAAAMPGVWTMHTLRHRYGTIVGQDDIQAAQQLLGHTSVATTQRYVLKSQDKLRAAAMLASRAA